MSFRGTHFAWFLALGGLVTAPSLRADEPAAAAAEAARELPAEVRRALAKHRRDVGSKLRGGADHYFVVILGEATDREREADVGDALYAAAATAALGWDAVMAPLLVATDGKASLSAKLPPPRPGFNRTFQFETRVIHTKEAAIEEVYAYTTEPVTAAPQPGSVRYRSWRFVAAHRDEAVAEEKRREADEYLLKTVPAPRPDGGEMLRRGGDLLKRLGEAGEAGDVEEAKRLLEELGRLGKEAEDAFGKPRP